MSKFLKINELQITDQRLLVDTLVQDMAFQNGVQGSVPVESFTEPEHLFGYLGDRRPETAEVIVRRDTVGDAANDLGFKRLPSGNFRPIISEYDSDYYNASWLDTLSQKYGERKYAQEMYNNGFSLASKKTLDDGSTEMSFVPMGGL